MENLEVLLSFPGIKKRIADSGLSSFEYRSGLEEYLNSNGNGKGTEETLSLYDNYIKIKRREEKFCKMISSAVWNANGILALGAVNFITASVGEGIFEKINSQYNFLYAFSAFTLAEYLAIKMGAKYLVKKCSSKKGINENKS